MWIAGGSSMKSKNGGMKKMNPEVGEINSSRAFSCSVKI